MGSGKSTILSKIDECSPDTVEVISLDQMVNDMYQKDKAFISFCFKTFGKQRIINHDTGLIDKKKVGGILFGELTAGQRKRFLRKLYNKLFWNLFKSVMNAFMFKDSHLMVLEVPLLFESKTLLPFCFPTCTIFVENEQILKERLEKRNDPNLESKLKKQMSWKEKVERSDFSIKNEGTIEEAYELFSRCVLEY